jgi:Leucine-rich repeat (LRR) protein
VSIRDVSFLRELPDIKSLDLSSTYVADIRPLTHCKGLQDLRIEKNPNITDISPLKNCKELRFLSLKSSYRITDFSPLKECPALQFVQLRVDQYYQHRDFLDTLNGIDVHVPPTSYDSDRDE